MLTSLQTAICWACVDVLAQSVCRNKGLGWLSHPWYWGMGKQWQVHTREHVRVSSRATTVCDGAVPGSGPCSSPSKGDVGPDAAVHSVGGRKQWGEGRQFLAPAATARAGGPSCVTCMALPLKSCCG